MTEQHAALIFISIDLVSGPDRLRDISREIGEIGRIAATSSVYKRYLNERSEDLNSELVMVMKVETQKSEMDIFRFLKMKEKPGDHHQLARPECFLLLSFDQMTRLVPGQNLPSPLLHSDRLVLRCAAEAWGSYEHPVLGQSLNEIVKSEKEIVGVEFFSQTLTEKTDYQNKESP